MSIELRIDLRAVAHHQKFDIGMPHQRKRRARYDNRCTEIAAHGVKRDLNLLRHKRSGNLIVAALTKPAASWKPSCPMAEGESQLLRTQPQPAATIAFLWCDTTA
jgi:hypothetical protein